VATSNRIALTVKIKKMIMGEIGEIGDAQDDYLSRCCCWIDHIFYLYGQDAG
jgi:hypothetical protein